ILAVFVEDVADLFVEPVFGGEFVEYDVVYGLGGSLGVGHLNNMRREALHELARQIADKFAGKKHPRM
ncbi:MAG TPA: hypothetical protein VFL57_08620, partial [Bryobacteraceae bacterium]|nr:hypothetical protein [Bryobacteraceae bacterium]